MSERDRYTNLNEKMKDELKHFTNTINELDNNHKKKMEQIIDENEKIKEQYVDLNDKQLKAFKDKEIFETTVSHLRDEINKLTEVNKDLKKQNLNLHDNYNNLNEEMGKLFKENEQFQDALFTADEKIKQLNKKIAFMESNKK